MPGEYLSLYEAMGGEPAIRQIVGEFYPLVQAHPSLGPLFPEDITPVMEKQLLFLSQFLGGPMLYTEQHGHPMMRARHLPFPITPERADAWLSCMREALSRTDVNPELQEVILERLRGPAHHFVNTDE